MIERAQELAGFDTETNSSPLCFGCAFFVNTRTFDAICTSVACQKEDRTDGREVIFVRKV